MSGAPHIMREIHSELRELATRWQISDERVRDRIAEDHAEHQDEIYRWLLLRHVIHVRRAAAALVENRARHPAPPRIEKPALTEAEERARHERQAAYDREETRRRAESDERFRRDMEYAINRFLDQLVVEWTEELRATPFRTGTGRQVTWGDATAEDHRLRLAALQRHLEGTARTAAMHEQAVRVLTLSGAETLNDYVRQVDERRAADV